MANYSVADVKRLRELTGSGMMDCKKALEESEGDYDKAVEVLRIKGAKDVGKRAERTTAEGLVAVAGGVMIELNSETDFVAKSAEFIALAEKIVAVAAEKGLADVDSLNAAELDGTTVADAVVAFSAKSGEKLVLRRVGKIDGASAVYLHKRSSDLPPAVGVLVGYEGEGDAAANAARSAAMQIAALKAQYVTRDDVPADIVAKERDIAEATAREEGKPEQALAKIVEGRLNGFYKDVVLLDQPSVTDSKKTVGAVLTEAGANVTSFLRFEVGQA